MLVFLGQHLSGLAVLLGERTHDEDVIFWYDDTIFSTLGVKILGSGLLLSVTLGYLCVGFRWVIDRINR
ncbi:MAG TPA: hypothetical protein VFI31_00385 [Pirellulales bacterium]|nr:hypothetical protein [Pirellulales bacterium]